MLPQQTKVEETDKDVSSDLISHLLACVVHCCLNPTTIENRWKIKFFCLFFFSRELSGMSAALCLVTVAWRHHNNESLKMFDQNRLDDSSRCSPTPWMTHYIRAGKRELECKSIISSFNCLVPYISFNICSR